MHGGIAQLARALGSYPKGRGFKSNFRYHGNHVAMPWPGGQAAKTPPFHGGNTGSIPVRVTIQKASLKRLAFLFFYLDFRAAALSLSSRIVVSRVSTRLTSETPCFVGYRFAKTAI